MTSVLVVEDDRAIQELLQTWLAQSGYRVIPALSAEAGLEAIRIELPDVVILDWMLPGMTGLQMARQLRGDRRTKALPIILVTARGDEPDAGSRRVFLLEHQCSVRLHRRLRGGGSRRQRLVQERRPGRRQIGLVGWDDDRRAHGCGGAARVQEPGGRAARGVV